MSRSTSSLPPFACGLALMRRSPRGASAASSGDELAVGVEQRLRLVAAHPGLELRQLLGVVAGIGHRHLVRAEGALDRVAVDLLRAGPALGRAQDDGRPARPLEDAVLRGPRAGWRGCARSSGRASRRTPGARARGSSPSTKKAS